MRLYERTREAVEIAPRIAESGALGGRAERFSDARAAAMATVLPMGGDFAGGERGPLRAERFRLLLPADAQVGPGDGIVVRGEMTRVLSVARWTAHLELTCEALE